MIAAIILAAGFGRRFGSNKLLYEIEGKPMYLHVAEKVSELSKKKIGGHELKGILVTQYKEILRKAEEMQLHPVMNLGAEEGIASSVREGIMAAESADWYLFLTADQPYLSEPVIESFINAALGSHKKMASVCCGDQPGSPTMFHRDYRDKLLTLRGDRGGRVFMKENPEEVFFCQISRREIEDIDFMCNSKVKL